MESFVLYNKLITLPLFLGMSKDDLERIISTTKFDFQKAEANNLIVEEGEKSGQLLLLVDGEVQMETPSDDNGYSVIEFVKAPAAIQPERTFGLTQRYSSSVRATTPSSLIRINKNETLRLTNDSLIFRLNLLNIISTALQKKNHEAWKMVPQNLDQRICRFFTIHCTHPGGRKIFKIKMRRLAAELNDNRLHVSQALHRMSEKGILTMSRGSIEIPSIERMIGSW
ncbi:MAG: Crp/Fnr family transcriptional regulator [Prevotella sp.]|nr:Crp/Fnr family transcriptional regulator [Prevotella sp.]